MKNKNKFIGNNCEVILRRDDGEELKLGRYKIEDIYENSTLRLTKTGTNAVEDALTVRASRLVDPEIVSEIALIALKKL